MPLLKLEYQAASSAVADTAPPAPKKSRQPRTSVSSCASAAVMSAPAAAAVTSQSRDSLNDVDLNASQMSYEETGQLDLDNCKLPGINYIGQRGAGFAIESSVSVSLFLSRSVSLSL